MTRCLLEVSAALLHGSDYTHIESIHGLNLSNADRFRASKLKHVVEGMNRDGDLGGAAGFRSRT